MPEGQKNEKVAWLGGEEWSLPPQVEALEKWLQQQGDGLPPGRYVADIGFCWRRDACAGGSALAANTLRLMADAGMDLFLSEYSGFSDEWNDKIEQSGPDNPRPCGTSGMSPADSASRAGDMPEASGGI